MSDCWYIPEEIKSMLWQEIEFISKISHMEEEEVFKILFDKSRRFPIFSDDLLRIIIEAYFKGYDIKKLKYLDLGSGYGLGLIDGTLNGFNVKGIEPSSPKGFINRNVISKMLLRAYKVDDKIVYDIRGEDMHALNDLFDVVYSYQVLEHVDDIEKVLGSCKSILKPKSICYFTIPNYDSFYEGHYRILWLPFVLRNKKIAKLYINKVFKRDPSYIETLNFTNRNNILKIAEKVFPKEENFNFYIIPWGVKGGIVGRLIYISELFSFYTRLKNDGYLDMAESLSRNYKIERREYIYKLISSLFSFVPYSVKYIFVTDFRLIILRRN